MLNNFAVVGMGSIAKRHISNLRDLHPSAKIYAVSSSGHNDAIPNDADAVLDLDEVILLKPKFVVIASPANSHVGIAKILIKHKIPILIEKPVAHNFQECLDLQAFCTRHISNKLAVGYCLRFLPSIQVVRDYLASGHLGKIYNVAANVGQYLPSWRSDKGYKDSVSANKALGGGALLELSHELDYLLWLFGDLTLKYSWLRTTDELDLDVEDIANLVLISSEDVFVTVHLDFIQKSTQRNCEIIGQNGRLVWDLLSNKVVIYTEEGSLILYSDSDYDKNNMYLDMMRAFEDESKDGSDCLATLNSSCEVVRIIEEAKHTNQRDKIS